MQIECIQTADHPPLKSLTILSIVHWGSKNELLYDVLSIFSEITVQYDAVSMTNDGEFTEAGRYEGNA